MNKKFAVEDFKKYCAKMNCSGIYFLRAIKKETIELPDELKDILRQADHDIIYIGKGKNLRRRLNQEIRGSGHGTFFRSLGAVLNLMPKAGCLIGRQNTNYVFKPPDKDKIIKWIEKNTKVSWIPVNRQLDEREKRLIRCLRPLFNINHNPDPPEHIKNKRRDCIEFARKP